MNLKNPNAFQFQPDDMIAVSRDEFIPGSTVPADVFLKLADNKYILIAREGKTWLKFVPCQPEVAYRRPVARSETGRKAGCC